MKLLTQEILKKLPALYSQEGKGLEAKVQVKFFTPWSHWTWYASEFDGKDTFYGLICGDEQELGYFSLSEIQSLVGPAGLRVERDMYFKPTTFKQLMKQD